MSDISSVYNNQGRKRELIEGLRRLESFYLEAANSLDKKAWDILGVTSATFGIVVAVQVNMVSDKTYGGYWIGLALVFFLYLLEVWQVLAATAPRKWSIVPGGEDGNNSYEILMNKYIAISDDDYLNQLIADYVGNRDVNDPNKIVLGSTQFNEASNQDKAMRIRKAAELLAGIVAALSLLSVVPAIKYV